MNSSMGPKRTLLAVSLGWGFTEAAVLLFDFTFVSNGGTIGPFSFGSKIQPVSDTIISLKPILEGSVLIVALLGGYILADFLESFKAVLISQAIAVTAVLSGALVSYSIFSSSPDLFSFTFVSVFVFLIIFVAELGISLFGALLGVILEPNTPYTADSRFLTLGLILDLGAILFTLFFPKTSPWIVLALIPPIVLGFALAYYGQVRARMLKPRTAGFLIIAATVVTSLAVWAILVWNEFYDQCTRLGICVYEPSGIAHIIWALCATLLPPGFVILGSIFPRHWSVRTKDVTIAEKQS